MPILCGRLLLVFFLLLGVVAAQDSNPAAGELAALESSWKTADDKAAAYAELKPKFEAFAERHSGTEPALSARLWLLRRCSRLRRRGNMGATAKPIADRILKDHIASKRMAEVVELRSLFDTETFSGYLEKLSKSSPHRKVRADAFFALSQILLRQGPGGMQRGYEILELLQTKYAEIPWRRSSYGAIAEAYLEPHSMAALQPGRPAPEIEGLDPEGRPMKLSEFRGRVVVLEFWGHW